MRSNNVGVNSREDKAMKLQLRKGASKWEQLSPANRRAMLRSWMPRLIHELTDTFYSRQIFLEFMDVVRANATTLAPPTYVGWVRNNYLNAQAIALRRIVDKDRRSASLMRLLELLKSHPETLNLRALQAQFASKRLPSRWADTTWRKVVGVPNELNQATLVKDIGRLDDAFARVRRLVNKRIAHTGARGAIRRLPQFKDVDHAMALANRMLTKYNTLLTGDGLASVNATPQYDWRDVLATAWLPTDRRKWPHRRYEEPALIVR
jgi:hypothetical protein